MVENFIDFCSRSALLMGWGKREKKKKKKGGGRGRKNGTCLGLLLVSPLQTLTHCNHGH